jgi:hypothetical protein
MTPDCILLGKALATDMADMRFLSCVGVNMPLQLSSTIYQSKKNKLSQIKNKLSQIKN